MSAKTRELFAADIVAINVGTEFFADSLRKQGVEVEQVEWRPPAGGDKEVARLLELMGM